MRHLIFSLLFTILMGCIFPSYGKIDTRINSFEFYGQTFHVTVDQSIIVDFKGPLSEESVLEFYTRINAGNYQPLIDSLISFRNDHKINDWLYYQLIRKTAESISPKANDYNRYTLYQWFLLAKSGYDATLGLVKDQLLFYVKSNDQLEDIPFYTIDNNQYMCLNYHDYGKIDFEKNKISPTNIVIAGAEKAFSYKVTQLPDFKLESYKEKEIGFNYKQKAYHFKIMLNPEVANIFANYPIVDFGTYFNIPLSKETYRSLIPPLKENLKGMSEKKGVDYLMKFTRNAFIYEDDNDNFGKEKRLSPEQTLFYDQSDCDDRVALFFYLVKEIYNLPMIALLYPTHITMAVQFDKPVGKPIIYDGKKYYVCEPTPQLENLKIGQLAPKFQNLAYQVVYQYAPDKKIH